ncbi:MAG: hypothetical protein JF887_05300 [Candidatus Dormibacteraeota bacterium]|uniref:Uncharacterized protein n=1 Tax=Candidatus Amunia macphersoniae TaxID=3127014 RepID=A0A934KMR1_9BACT|nr:hypothetical protein [Candidatus Dormibacteraeota bacterium]
MAITPMAGDGVETDGALAELDEPEPHAAAVSMANASAIGTPLVITSPVLS